MKASAYLAPKNEGVGNGIRSPCTKSRVSKHVYPYLLEMDFDDVSQVHNLGKPHQSKRSKEDQSPSFVCSFVEDICNSGAQTIHAKSYS